MSFWADVPFSERVTLYGVSHILFILTVIVVVSIFVWKLDWVRQHKDIVRKIMISISLFQVVLLYTWSLVELGFDLRSGLPIHLCRMSTFLGLYFLITEDKRVFHALYYMSAFALVAIFYPVNVHPIYTHIIGYSYQLSHIMILLVWILGVFVYRYQPTFNILHQALIWFLIITLAVWRFNYAVGGGEYLYILSDVNRPFFKSWHDLLWILFTIVLSYIVMLGMTYPFINKKVE